MCFTYQNTLSASFKFSKIVKHKRPSSSLPLLPCGCCHLHVGGWACVSLCKCTNWYRAWRQREESLSPIHKANTHPSHGHFFAQNQQKCWQINQLGIFCKVRDVSVILLIPCSCETTSQPLARRVILRQVFFPPPLPHNEIWIEVVGIVGSCQQIPQLPATIDQSVPYLKHNCANPLARTDINPKPSSQRKGITGYKVVGANADTGTKEERCQC